MKLKSKKMLIIGIISFISIGIMLGCKWNYFYNNKSITSKKLYDYKINKINNDFIEYNQAIKNINFQINVLTRATSKNNNMLLKYNKIFKDNVSYKYLQKNKINSNIQIANSTIKKELYILNDMKNIIKNHPFNYLIFFNDRNYKIPNIVYKSQSNKLHLINSVKTYNSNIKKSNVSIKTISNQLEEAVIGLGTINSTISASRILLFSKVDYDYSNVYYFSTFLNNLSILNNTKSITNVSLENNNVHFNQKTSKKNNSINKISREALSILYFGYNTYRFLKKHKQQITILIGTAFAILTGSIIIIVCYKYLKMFRSVNNQYTGFFFTNEVVPSAVQHDGRSSGLTGLVNDDDDEAGTLISSLYESKHIESKLVTKEQFKAQLIDYGNMHWNVDSSTEDSIKTYMLDSITSNIKGKSVGLHQNVQDNNIKLLVQMVDFQLNRKMQNNHSYLKTNYGWFKMPKFEDIDKTKLTTDQKQFISSQCESFYEFLKLIPVIEKTDDIPTCDEIITRQILQDLKQIYIEYYTFLQSNDTTSLSINDQASQENEVTKSITLKDYFSDFCSTRLEKSNFDSLDHYNIKKEEISWDMCDKLMKYGW